MSSGDTPTTNPPLYDVVQHVFGTLIGCDDDTVKFLRKRGVRGFRTLLDADADNYVNNKILYRTEADMWKLWQQVARVNAWSRASDATAFDLDAWDALDSHDVRLQIAHLDANMQASCPYTSIPPPPSSSTT